MNINSNLLKQRKKNLSIKEDRDQMILNFQESPTSSFQSRVTIDSNQNNIIGLTYPRDIEIERKTLNYKKRRFP